MDKKYVEQAEARAMKAEERAATATAQAIEAEKKVKEAENQYDITMSFLKNKVDEAHAEAEQMKATAKKDGFNIGIKESQVAFEMAIEEHKKRLTEENEKRQAERDKQAREELQRQIKQMQQTARTAERVTEKEASQRSGNKNIDQIMGKWG